MSELIQESEVWWYWPVVQWEAVGYFRESVDEHPAEYEVIWARFDGIRPDGSNVSRADINGKLDALGLYESRIPEGFLRSDADIFVEAPSLSFEELWSVGAPEPTGELQLQCMIYGYKVWQRYRLCLAMQAGKLTMKGYRDNHG